MGTRPRGAVAGADGVGGSDGTGKGGGARGVGKRTEAARATGMVCCVEGRRTGEHTVNIHGENPRRIRTCCD